MNNEIKTVGPFKHFCITIGALPTSYLESMSYYETLCWLCKYLENTINPAVNQNAEALKELQEYVANYFDNLDVTEEINNKLDEMAEDGTLAQIINVEMIGTLSNLTTTDKTDLVSAINEVNEKTDDAIESINDFNLSAYAVYELQTPSEYIEISNSNISYSGSIFIARNTKGSIFKIYGSWSYTNATDTTQTGSITLKGTGLNPTEAFNIIPAGIIDVRNSATNEHYPLPLRVMANGDIVITELGMTPQTRDVIMFACIYFAQNFGD